MTYSVNKSFLSRKALVFFCLCLIVSGTQYSQLEKSVILSKYDTTLDSRLSHSNMSLDSFLEATVGHTVMTCQIILCVVDSSLEILLYVISK